MMEDELKYCIDPDNPPIEEDIRGAKFIIKQLDDCGDNEEKKTRFMIFLVQRWRMDIETWRQYVNYLHGLNHNKRRKRSNVLHCV